MSTTPPDETPPEPEHDPGAHHHHWSYTGLGQTATTGAILPVPGNAELAIYLFAVVVLAIICWTSDFLDAGQFASLFTFLTIGYILSRGIAKASRVLEQ